MYQIEYDFQLPRGYLDGEGNLHRDGTMRLATAADEILPLKDPRVQANQAYMVIILFARVMTRLGSLAAINPKVVEGLFAADLAYLQEFYNQINGDGTTGRIKRLICPHCQQDFDLPPPTPGES